METNKDSASIYIACAESILEAIYRAEDVHQREEKPAARKWVETIGGA